MLVIEIAKALSHNAKVLIMDEPTALAQKEIKTLFRIIRFLKESGVTIIYISHRLEEVYEICDRVTVLRDGKFVATKPVKELKVEELIRMMVGREARRDFLCFPYHWGRGSESGRINSPRSLGKYKYFPPSEGNISIAGMVGSGRNRALRAIYGVDPGRKEKYSSGEKK